MSALTGVRIKLVEFGENVNAGTKKTVRNNGVSVNRGLTVLFHARQLKTDTLLMMAHTHISDAYNSIDCPRCFTRKKVYFKRSDLRLNPQAKAIYLRILLLNQN